MSSKWFLSKTWPRPFYVLFRVGEMAISLLSRFINAAFLGGSTHQTTSSRCYIEDWPRGEAFVNALFFFQHNPRHCQWAWEREVAEAKKTLRRASPSTSSPSSIKEHDDA